VGWYVWLLVVMGIVGSVAVLVTLGRARREQAEWDAYVAELRAKGYALTLDDLEAQRATISDENNGALVIERLAERLDSVGDAAATQVLAIVGEDVDGPQPDPLPDHVLDALRTLVLEHADTLEALSALHDRPSGRTSTSYAVGDTNPFDLLLPSLKAWYAAARLLHISALVKAADGRLDEAIEQVFLQLRVAGTLDEEPCLVVHIVRIKITQEALTCLERVLGFGRPGDGAIARVAAEIDRRVHKTDIRPGLRSERATLWGVCELLAARRLSPADVGLPGSERVTRKAVRADQRAVIRDYDWVEALGPDHRMTGAPGSETRRDSPLHSGKWSHQKFGVIGGCVSAVDPAIELHVACVRRLTAARKALAVESFRAANGRLPSDCKELVPRYLESVPIDVFTDEPLGLQVRDDVLVVGRILDEEDHEPGAKVAQPRKRGRLLREAFMLPSRR
jgi:hypothetical protein